MASCVVEPLVAAPSGEAAAELTPRAKPARLASLDIVRGFTVLLMIFVDEVGDAYPHLDHSPWDGVTLADYVMPWFLFMVGTSLAISMRKYARREARLDGTRATLARAARLFALGLALQGGGWQGGGFPSDYTYGYNLATVRWPGILQRIGFAFFLGALIELWIPVAPPPPTRGAHLALFTSRRLGWLAAGAAVALHLVLTYATYVPDWTSEYDLDGRLVNTTAIACGVRGHTSTPQCSASAHYDRMLFGQGHLAAWMSTRLSQCSECAPGAPSATYRPNCAWRADAPTWCFAHMYDPEGALASLPTVACVWIGAHFGRAALTPGVGAPDGARGGGALPLLCHWLVFAAVLVCAGVGLDHAGVRMNKQLWSTSYTLYMSGTCALALAAVYVAVDAASATACTAWKRASRCARLALAPCEMVGMNAILFFFCHGERAQHSGPRRSRKLRATDQCPVCQAPPRTSSTLSTWRLPRREEASTSTRRRARRARSSAAEAGCTRPSSEASLIRRRASSPSFSSRSQPTVPPRGSATAAAGSGRSDVLM